MLYIIAECRIIDVIANLPRITIVSAISTERYFGVVYPLIHHSKITKVKPSLLLCVWSICAILLLLEFFSVGNPLQLFATISCASPILITVYTHTSIAFTVIR